MTLELDSFLAPDAETGTLDLKTELTQMVIDRARNAPRSQQQSLGPSEVGHPCDRKLAYGIMREPRTIDQPGDPLPSIVGTAAHKWMEGMLKAYNDEHGVRFLVEQPVAPSPAIPGSLDVYDIRTKTIIDWKFPSADRVRRYRKDGPGDQYRKQVHLYGRGMANLGLTPDTVAIMFMPRGGQLAQAYMWSEPYDPQIAQETLDRFWSVTAMIDQLDAEHHPETYAFFPTAPSTLCDYCPWFHPKPEGPYQCKGNAK